MSKDYTAPRLDHILVAIDGSEISDYALNFAIHIGERFGSKIDLLYVIPPTVPAVSAPVFDPMFGGAAMTPLPESASSQKEKETALSRAQSLVTERQKLVKARNLACDVLLVRSDDVGGEIVRRGAGVYDLIVIGSRGLGGLKSLILGSVSKKVAREAKGSVLVMKSRVDSIPKMLLAYDGSDQGRKALELAAELGKKFKAQVNVVCVASVPITPEEYVGPDLARYAEEAAQYAKDATSFLEAQGLRSEGKSFDARDIPRAIADEASKGEYDMIILGSRGYGRLKALFLGSVASGVADSAKTTVLIVR